MKNPCPHASGSYHDANQCDICKPHYAAHTRYYKDGDPYYDPNGGDGDGFFFCVALILVIGSLIYFYLTKDAS